MKRGIVALALTAAVAVGGAALLLWADRAYAARLAGETRDRFRDGILLGEDFVPLAPGESVLLYEETLSPVSALSAGESRTEKIWAPYLPDYGSGLSLTQGTEGGWGLSYQTLDGLEVSADYTAEGVQRALTVYLPEPDLEVRLTGTGEDQEMTYAAHARRGASLAALWSALGEEVGHRLDII